MKKFYSTLALAAAVALSASAADLKDAKVQVKPISMATTVELQYAPETPAMMKATPVIAKAKPTKVDEVYGYYEMNFNYFTRNFPSPISLTVYQSEAEDKVENQVAIAGWSPYTDFEAIFDAEKGTLTLLKDQVAIPARYTSDSDVDVLLANAHVKNWDATTFADLFDYPDTPIVFYFNEDGGFQVASRDDGFAFKAPAGLYAAGASMLSTRLGAPDNTGWTDCGQATFNDGWFVNGMAICGYGGEVTFPAFDVKLYRNNENPNLYRLYNPYGGVNEMFNMGEPETSENYLAFNQSFIEGCIDIDVTDPECVLVVPGTYSGLDCPIWVMGLFYMYNQAGDFVYVSGKAEEPDASKEDLTESWKAFVTENGEASTLSTYNVASNVVTIKDGFFTMSGYSGYTTWTEFGELLKQAMPETFGSLPLPIDMTSVIILPDPAGINNVIMDNSNKTLEYYNLQGIRVNNPENGIFIRRQGNDVQKVYVR